MLQEQFLQRSPALPLIELRQASRSSACYQAHTHDEFSFGVIDRGHAAYRNRQRLERIGVGSLVTVNPGEVHSCNPAAGQWSYRMLFVDASWLGTLQREAFGGSADYCCFPDVCAAGASAGFDGLFASLQRSDGALEAESRLIDLLQPLFACQQESASTLHQSGLLRARELIMDRLGCNLQLDERIKQARARLRADAVSLNDLALDLGFADQAHFQRHFKLRAALTPGQYRAFHQAA